MILHIEHSNNIENKTNISYIKSYFKLIYLIASRSPPGQDCRRQAMKEQMVEKMKYSRRALWKRTATNMPEESEHSYSKRNQG